MKMAKEREFVHPGLAGNLAGGGSLQALLGKELARREDKPLAAIRLCVSGHLQGTMPHKFIGAREN